MDEPHPDTSRTAPRSAPTETWRDLERASFRVSAGLAVVVPLAYACCVTGGARWMAYGAAGWFVAVMGIKMPIFRWIDGPLKTVSPLRVGLVHGCGSAAAELGITLAFFCWSGVPPDTGAALSLGLGAGCLEILIVALGVVAAKFDDTKVDEAPHPAPPAWPGVVARLAFLIERWFVAMPGHIGSRALISATAMGSSVWPALLGFVAFVLVDGLPGYGERQGWSWDDPGTLARYYLVAGSLGWLELGAALLVLW